MSSQSGGDDPLDFTEYDRHVSSIHDDLKSEIAKIRAGGRDIDSVENIRLDKDHNGDANNAKMMKKEKGKEKGKEKDEDRSAHKDRHGQVVGDLSSIVMRGRNIIVMVGEKENYKLVLSALQSIPDLSPQQASAVPGSDPLHIIIPVPPITRESRMQACKHASDKGDVAMSKLRDARSAHKKKLRAIELSSHARGAGKKAGTSSAHPVSEDELRKAEKEMEKKNEKANAEVKKIVEDAKRRLER